MIKALSVLLFALVASAVAQPIPGQPWIYLAPTNPPAQCSLAWDPSPDASVTGYRLYYGVSSRAYTNQTTVGNVTNFTVKGLARGVDYYFTATAYDAEGLESEFCNEVTWRGKAPPAPPGGVRTNNAVVKVSIQSAPTPKGPWFDYAFLLADAPRDGFYRSVLLMYPPPKQK